MSSYAVVTIASVALEDAGSPCKNFILDAGALLPTFIGVNRFSASGSVFTQVLSVAVGAKFGIKSAYLPKATLDLVVAAINAAMNGGIGSFPVVAADELVSISVNAVPDFEGNWVTWANEQRTDSRAIRDVVFRFVTVT